MEFLYFLLGFITLVFIMIIAIRRAFPNIGEFGYGNKPEPEYPALIMIIGVIAAIISIWIWPLVWVYYFWNQRKNFKTALSEFTHSPK